MKKNKNQESIKIKQKNEYLLIFIVAAVMGVVGQTVLPWLSSQLNPYYFEFRFLISNVDIYPFIIVLLIGFKNTEPKRAFRRVCIYFVGLCLGYYGCTSSMAVYNAVVSGNANYLFNVVSDLKDAFGYIFIGVLAGIWGYSMLKFKSKKYVYELMLLPFIGLSACIAYSNFACEPPQIFMIIVDVLCLTGIIAFSLRKKYSE